MPVIQKNDAQKWTVKFHCILALTFRSLLLVFSEWQDYYLTVKYTDVDYQIFTDGAAFVYNGSSPFDRHTYRYTPFLAYLLIPNVFFHPLWGKILFSIFDVYTGYLIYEITKFTLCNQISISCAMLWLYNPLPAVIATRGSAESIMSSLILATLKYLHHKKIFYAGLVYGFAVHFKLYPIIYAISIYLNLSSNNNFKWKYKSKLLPNRNHFIFAFGSSITFLMPTIFAFKLYGIKYIEEAFLYHLSRKDIRHNFSPFFYMLYLLDESDNKWLSFLTFLPQVFVLLILSLKFGYEKSFIFCIFIQTFIFVALNKVCTSQYFLWYLCIMPLIMPYLNMPWKKGILLFFVWLLGQALWLIFAYLLEFQGINSFIFIWVSGLVFYVINIWIVHEFINCYITPFSKH